eukprot:CAMPEP_0183344530 /NCGR_PEP_ID=MMETSP0164_2-20130417/10182_1 /TAXON_ID=221442 /ORGANISM="Coccolithus pelagicus ssp braarudi, Strain PLY182g" /LENGTH=125 /DNA_ID=CAMNT_0025515539 /DNA_START=141 /DNA_END=519 /DNA_ORIENTATION=+
MKYSHERKRCLIEQIETHILLLLLLRLRLWGLRLLSHSSAAATAAAAAAAAARKKAAPKAAAPKADVKLPTISTPKLQAPEGDLAKAFLSPAAAGLGAGAAIGLVPAGALIAARSWLVSGRNSRE